MKKVLSVCILLVFISSIVLLGLEIKNNVSIYSSSLSKMQSKIEKSLQIENLVNNNEIDNTLNMLNEGKNLEASLNLNKIIKISKQVIDTSKIEKIFSYLSDYNIKYASIDNSLLEIKIQNLYDYVSDNRWNRLKAQSNKILNYGPDYIKNKVNIENEINQINSITTESTLSTLSKKNISSQTHDILFQLQKLTNKTSNLKALKQSIKPILLEFKIDLLNIMISQKRTISNIKTSIFHSLIYIALIICMPLIYMTLRFFNWWRLKIHSSKRYLKAEKNKIDKIVFDALKNDVIPTNIELEGEFSSQFHTELKKYRSIVHQKATLGELFSSTIPFPSLLLDSTSEVVWANDHLHALWKIDKDQTITWESLSKQTSLNNLNKMIDLKNKSVYEIKVTPSSDKNNSTKCDMYIEPVIQGGEKLTLIFFYPIKTNESVLKKQKDIYNSNVKSMIEIVANVTLNKHLKAKIKDDFKEAGMIEVYNNFMSLHDAINQQKLGLMKEINNLEDELESKACLAKNQGSELTSLNQILHSTEINLSKIKEHALLLNVVQYEWKEIFTKSIKNNKAIINDEEKLIEDSENIEEVLLENRNVFRPIMWVKEDFEKVNEKIDTINDKLTEIVESKRPLDMDNITYLKYEFDKSRSLYNLALTNFNTSLEKLKIISKRDQINLPELKTKFKSCKDDLSKIETSQKNLIEVGSEREKRLVSELNNAIDNLQRFHKSPDQSEINCKTNHTSSISTKRPDIDA